MKKLTLILILLFLIPFVSAEVNVLNQIEQTYNINEKIPLKLAVSSTQEMDGSVKSSVICDNTNVDYFVTPFTFKTTPQELTIPNLRLTKNMLGKCSLEVSLTDFNSILLEKKVVGIFEVSSILILNVELNKDKFSPSEELNIKGDIKNVRGVLLDKGTVTISLDNKSSSTDLSKGEFSYNYRIPGDIKSNAHSLKINFEDAYGNKASKDFSIFVNPNPTNLKTLLNKLDFLPEDRISIEALLYDQANDIVENNALIKVYNPKNDLAREGNYKLEFNLDQYALPGTWLIKTSTDKFKIESKFNVGEVKKVDVYVEDGIIYVKNIGNVPYTDDVQVRAIGADGKEFTKKVSLNPKESKIVKLSDELKQGQYNLDVLSGSQDQSFENVNVPKTNNQLYLTGEAINLGANKLIDKPLLLISIILAILLIIYIIRANRRRRKFSRERESQLGYMKAREIEKYKLDKGIKPRRFNIDEKEAKDFTDQMVKKMNEKKNNDKGYMYKNPPKDNKPGLFGMFE